jgi:hypothetical protein
MIGSDQASAGGGDAVGEMVVVGDVLGEAGVVAVGVLVGVAVAVDGELGDRDGVGLPVGGGAEVDSVGLAEGLPTGTAEHATRLTITARTAATPRSWLIGGALIALMRALGVRIFKFSAELIGARAECRVQRGCGLQEQLAES